MVPRYEIQNDSQLMILDSKKLTKCFSSLAIIRWGLGWCRLDAILCLGLEFASPCIFYCVYWLPPSQSAFILFMIELLAEPHSSIL